MTSPDPTEKRPRDRFADRRRRATGWRSRDVVRAAALVIALYLVLRLLWFAQLLVLTTFLGVLFGLAVTAGVDRVVRFRIPRGIAAALIVFGSIGMVVGFFAWTAPLLREQSSELRTKLPESLDKLDVWLEAHRSGVVGMFLNEPEGATARADQPAADSTTHVGTTLRARVLSQLSGARSYFLGFLSSTVAVIGGMLLVIFLSIYIATEPDTYHDGLMHLFPRRTRRRAGEVLTAIATALRKWLLTQLIAMVAIGSVTTIALLLLGVRAAFPLGVLAGLFEFIPTIGPVLSAAPAIAMGFVDSPEKALWVGLAYVAIQFLENHLLIPLLMREGVDLPPALTVVWQALMALVFGFLGLLVAVPALAAAMVTVKMLYVESVVGDDVEVLDAGPKAQGATERIVASVSGKT